MPTTRLASGLWGGRPAGSFAGKALEELSNRRIVTGLWGGPSARFEGKTFTDSVDRRIVTGLWGGPGVGDFGGKAATEPADRRIVTGLWGGPAAGDFGGKASTEVEPADRRIVTGLWGGPAAGDFSGKTSTEVEPADRRIVTGLWGGPGVDFHGKRTTDRHAGHSEGYGRDREHGKYAREGLAKFDGVTGYFSIGELHPTGGADAYFSPAVVHGHIGSLRPDTTVFIKLGIADAVAQVGQFVPEADAEWELWPHGKDAFAPILASEPLVGEVGDLHPSGVKNLTDEELAAVALLASRKLRKTT